MAVAVVAIGTFFSFHINFILLTISFEFDMIIFEIISAFATVGLSTGITPSLPFLAGKYLLVLLMFAGRIGTMTVTAALAMRHHQKF